MNRGPCIIVNRYDIGSFYHTCCSHGIVHSHRKSVSDRQQRYIYRFVGSQKLHLFGQSCISCMIHSFSGNKNKYSCCDACHRAIHDCSTVKGMCKFDTIRSVVDASTYVLFFGSKCSIISTSTCYFNRCNNRRLCFLAQLDSITEMVAVAVRNQKCQRPFCNYGIYRQITRWISRYKRIYKHASSFSINLHARMTVVYYFYHGM